jgi:hypothetical protein
MREGLARNQGRDQKKNDITYDDPFGGFEISGWG